MIRLPFGKLRSIFLVSLQSRHFHASITRHRRAFSEEDKATIIRMYKERVRNKDIAQKLGRSLQVIHGRVLKDRHGGLLDDRKKMAKSDPLTAEEYELVKAARKDSKSWSECTSLVSPRSADLLRQQYSRARYQFDDEFNTTPWSEEEDCLLRELRDQKLLPWAQIAEAMPHREPSSIRWHYNQVTPYRSRTRMPKTEVWSTSDFDVLKAHFAAGKTARETAVLMGRSLSCVLFKWHDLRSGTKPSHSNPVKLWTAAELKTLVSMKSNGATIHQIAQSLDRTASSVRNRWADYAKGRAAP